MMTARDVAFLFGGVIVCFVIVMVVGLILGI
jgi:hypothetical protein